MDYIIILETMLILLLLVLFYKRRRLAKKVPSTSLRKNEIPKDSIDIKRREFFRVSLKDTPCLVELKDFENDRLEKLKNKQFDATLENISLGGAKITCLYNLPVKETIVIRIAFRLKGEEFRLTGEIVRKEEHNHNQSISYGVRFLNVMHEEQEDLSSVLNQIIVENHRIVC